MPDIVVELRGGAVVGVYTDLEEVRVTLVDWDDIADGDRGSQYPAGPLRDIPEETKVQWSYATEPLGQQ